MMTMYQYLKALPKNLFESTLAGMMNIETEAGMEKLKQIMDQPYTDYFPEIDFADVASSNISGLNVLGRTVSSLPDDKQEQLAHAMREYCEVCDYINKQLESQQRSKEGV